MCKLLTSFFSLITSAQVDYAENYMDRIRKRSHALKGELSKREGW